MRSFSLENIKIIVSNRTDGSFRDPNKVKDYLRENCSELSKNDLIFYLKLEHLDKTLDLEGRAETELLWGDAFYSRVFTKNEKRVVLSMVLGDCFPIIIFDQKRKKIAMIHGGWRSLHLNIIEKTIRRIGENETGQLRSRIEDFWVWIGPGIRKESYLFSEKPKQADEKNWKNHIFEVVEKSENLDNGKLEKKWQIDLPGFIRAEFLRLGFKKKQILDSKIDSYLKENDLFSHKRSVDQGDEDGRFIVASYFS